MTSLTGTRAIIWQKAHLWSSSFWIWHTTEHILRHYLTSYNCNDKLTLFADAPCYRKFDKLEEESIVVTLLEVHEDLFNCCASIERSTSEFSLRRVTRSQDDEWSRDQVSSGMTGFAQNVGVWRKNADKIFEFSFFWNTRANVTKYSCERFKVFL